MLTSAKDTHG